MISIFCAVRGAKSAMLFRACGRENILRVAMEIIEQIENYRPYNEQEARDKSIMLDCLRAVEDVFTRVNRLAHMTA